MSFFTEYLHVFAQMFLNHQATTTQEPYPPGSEQAETSADLNVEQLNEMAEAWWYQNPGHEEAKEEPSENEDVKEEEPEVKEEDEWETVEVEDDAYEVLDASSIASQAVHDDDDTADGLEDAELLDTLEGLLEVKTEENQKPDGEVADADKEVEQDSQEKEDEPSRDSADEVEDKGPMNNQVQADDDDENDTPDHGYRRRSRSRRRRRRAKSSSTSPRSRARFLSIIYIYTCSFVWGWCQMIHKLEC